MGDKSAIQWTDATWNPTTGCDRVSPGCAHCYALDLAGRLKKMGAPACQTAGVAFFFKQHGGRTPKSGGRELDGRTWDEFPRQAVSM